jgi:hypothetical protein
MRTGLSRLGIFGYALVALAATVGTAEFVFAQGVEATLPANASAKNYGSGWDCDKGYRKNAGTCSAVSLPANGYLTESATGSGWTCARGYRAVADACAAIVVPENAYLTARTYDSGWECERGYREANGACNIIEIPSNGFLSGGSYGQGWECARGFRAAGANCVAVDVPENAHLGFSGHDWDCNKPYTKRNQSCT